MTLKDDWNKEDEAKLGKALQILDKETREILINYVELMKKQEKQKSLSTILKILDDLENEYRNMGMTDKDFPDIIIVRQKIESELK